MSTVSEVIAARHCNMKVFALSLVSNLVILDYDIDDVVDCDEVIAMGHQRCHDMEKFLLRFVAEMSTTEDS